jgi:hypothetical protein
MILHEGSLPLSGSYWQDLFVRESAQPIFSGKKSLREGTVWVLEVLAEAQDMN